MIRRLVFVAEEKFDVLDLAGPLQVMSTADQVHDCYELITASPLGGSVKASAGLRVDTQPLPAIEPASIDTLLVVGGAGGDGTQRAAAVGWLTRNAAAIRRVCGIGLGVDVLARSGLVARSATAVHWRRAGLAGRDPRRSPIVRRHGPTWTCAGGTAAIDLALSLVAEDLGHAAALAVAEALLAFVWRHPDDPQLSETLSMQIRGGAPFAELLRWIRSNLSEDLSVEALARWCAMTPRTFARRFVKTTGTTPAAAVSAMRAEMAAALLRSSSLPVKQVAALAGFGSEISLRRAFAKSGRRLPQ